MFGDRVINLGRLPLPEDAPRCLDIERLRQVGDRPKDLLLALKFSLRSVDSALSEAFWSGMSIEVLVQTRAWAVEQILLTAWERLFPTDEGLALVAVGGFGRGELHRWRARVTLLRRANGTSGLSAILGCKLEL